MSILTGMLKYKPHQTIVLNFSSVSSVSSTDYGVYEIAIISCLRCFIGVHVKLGPNGARPQRNFPSHLYIHLDWKLKGLTKKKIP